MLEISVLYLHQTQKAVLIDDAGNEVWIPKSLIDEDDVADLEEMALTRGDSININVKEWFLEQEGLI